MSTCSRSECSSKVKSKGLCARHYQHWYRHNIPGQLQRNSERQKAYMKANPEQKLAHRAYVRERKTGFSPQLVVSLRSFQEGKCGLCSTPMKVGGRSFDSECADHCHSSNTPRGLLCSSCNKSLGLYELRQKPAGLLIIEYEKYLHSPPVSRLPDGAGICNAL